ncbi:hypothetical protein EOA27_32390 [Mesorhizobium sp. M2A.F.Ca.ET.037.01.1.1]|uniref:hypothetical protein n=1 Tax=unclassified Mesorhizobium TaxID=325217 RepID=UPI000F74F08C|nr:MULTISPECIES: hypothetical protein [unclassified Mesorhizobium]RUY03091.1 hypothetical protein EOA25_20475 [Mesorhizobium sp. M2A.F.Ca.ET.040.01.1.1]RVC58983.1 hypothetical protein EN759_33285 [Mesorhizobium sp. M00.F.Ca.ET.038.03.1.1]RVC65030.1 hypothetical protein EN766_35110 [Mesorhizobium sp. M2A.F.Ca.ET.046.02.1.1]AZO06636.1 hypothetical protein EJ068_28925 [Mesorhizobium sp. M2A.F.Ca.ET.043.02.1.1]AZO39024.1 hypothetical protein EJ072_34615 [Mesorhizobium sp. M2A.F.Ca.ET.046.03.2.1]
MAGKTTHDQQQRIIEERVNTKNAGKDFNAREELKRPSQERATREKGSGLKAGERDLIDPDDRQMLRGENQESPHRKRRGD